MTINESHTPTAPTNFTLLGPRGVLIQLDKLKSATTKESGILVPSYENYETEGGRPAAKLNHEVYSLLGTITQLSHKAKEIAALDGYQLTTGARVVVYASAKVPNNWFVDPSKLENPVNDFDGSLLIHPSQIQCILNTSTTPSTHE